MLCFVLHIETLHLAPARHLWRMLLYMRKLHLRKELIFLSWAQVFVRIDLMQLRRQIHLRHEILAVPVSRQNIQNGSVSFHEEELQVVRSGTVCGIDCITTDFMPSRDAGIWFVGYVAIAANKVFFQEGERGV